MTSLLVSLVLFLPTWSADAPTEKRIQLVREPQGQYATLQECGDVLKQLSPMIGMYSQIYPEKKGYHIGFVMECVPSEEI